MEAEQCVQKDTDVIKPSEAHQEDVIVCCCSSSTKQQITTRLSTVSLADEWQRQEKLILSHPCDALKSEVYLGGHMKKLRNDRQPHGGRGFR